MDYLIIDVREPAEYTTGHVDGAINLPPQKLIDGAEIKKFPKETKIIVYCRSGNRSEVAKNILNSMGYSNVTNGINKEYLTTKYLSNRNT